MSLTMTVLGGDARQKYLAAFLTDAGFFVHTYAVPGLQDTDGSAAEAAAKADAVLLPMPALLDGETIRTADGSGLPLMPILHAMKAGALICGGKLDDAEAHFQQYGLPAFDYAADPALAVRNAVPTAEGAIRLAMELLPITLAESHILLIGFGRIGKVLAVKLQALGADVTVAARKSSDRALAETLGCRSDVPCAYAADAAAYDCVINTVPASVLTQALLSALRPDCPILDLASVPGGRCEDAVPMQPYIPALSLPGKEAPQSAARAIFDCILPHLTANF